MNDRSHNFPTILRAFLSALLIALLSACSPQEKYPESYGLYFWNGQQWAEVGKHKQTIALQMPNDTKFLIHAKAIEKQAAAFSLHQKFYFRNQIGQDRDGKNRVVEKELKNWDVKEKSQPIEGRFAPIKGQSEMVQWTPAAKLGPGVYQPFFGRDEQEAFLVDKTAVLTNLQQSTHCVDVVLTRKFMWDNPIPAKYSPCASEAKLSVNPEEARKKRLAELYSKQDGDRSLTKEEREEIKRLESR